MVQFLCSKDEDKAMTLNPHIIQLGHFERSTQVIDGPLDSLDFLV